MMTGILITFEGIEGSGKTTQVQLVSELLSKETNRKIVITQEPGGTEIGGKIRSLLLDTPTNISEYTELFLFLADRSQHIREIINPELEKGSIVLCDRFIYSTIAYQGYGRGLDIDLLNQLNNVATDYMRPNYTFWLDLASEKAFERMKEKRKLDRIEQESLEFFNKVRLGFSAIHYKNQSDITRIYTGGDKNETARLITEIIVENILT